MLHALIVEDEPTVSDVMKLALAATRLTAMSCGGPPLKSPIIVT
jgi:hypothetical protein